MKVYLNTRENLKEVLKEYLTLFRENQWLKPTYVENILETIEKEIITIGVVGQMKNGKSTLINALIFGDTVLPSASTPMTSSLTRIGYGEKEEYSVEFISEEEWDKLKEIARKGEDSDAKRVAEGIVEKGEMLSFELFNLLGKSKIITRGEILDYVGAEGLYSDITKTLSIKYPHPILKNTVIVDTPGFNDPVVSRENKTRQFLSEANIVLIVLRAERPFDEQDKSIMLDQMGIGSGSPIFVINKYDTELDERNTPERIVENVKKKIRSQIEILRKENQTVVLGALEHAPVVLFSALFALLGKIDDGSLKRDIELSETLDEIIKPRFPELKSKEDFIRVSKIDELEAQIQAILEKENSMYKVIAGNISQALTKRKEEIVCDISSLERDRNFSNHSKKRVEEERKNIEEIEKEIFQNILEIKKGIYKEIDYEKVSIYNALKREVEYIKEVKLKDKIPEQGWTSNSTYRRECKSIVDRILTEFQRTVKDRLETDFVESVKTKLESGIRELSSLIENNRMLIEPDLLLHAGSILETRDIFFQNLETPQLSQKLLKVDISEVNGYLWFFGLNKKIIIEEVKKQIERALFGTEDKLMDLLEGISQIFGEHIEKLDDYVNEGIQPLRSRLDDVARIIDMKDKFDLVLQEQIAEKIKTEAVLDNYKTEFNKRIAELFTIKN